jgi:TonB-linked SusC/RagA family outer membrane protein
MTRILSLFVVFMLTGVLAFAQTRTVTGVVTDPSGAYVSFATITESGTKNSVSSDVSGSFSIKVKSSTSELVYSASGFTTKTVPIVGTKADAVLQRGSSTELVGVVVNVGLGRSRLKSSLGFAAASLAPKEIVQAGATNLQNALAAKVSGLNINTVNSGVLGNNVRITLRNIRSLTGNNQPLLLLDGVPIALSYISSINPNDVGDVTILKSAASTAIYGPDGVNGAIVITTKKGTRGTPVITLSHSTQFEQISYLPNFQTRFGSGYDQDPNTGQGEFKAIEQQSWGSEFDGSVKQFGQTGPQGQKFIGTYDYKQNGRRNFFQTGVTNQTDLSYSAENFYLSAQNVDISGTMKNDVNRRRTVAMRTEKTINKFKAIVNLRYTNGKFNIASQPRLVYYNVTSAPGQYDLGQLDDWKNDYFSSPDGYYTTYLDGTGKTPAFLRDNQRLAGKSDDIIGNLEFNYKANQNLNFVYRLGTTLTNSVSTSTTNAYKISPFAKTLTDPMSRDIPAALSEATTFSSRINSEILINYDKKLSDKLSFSATAGHNFRVITSKGQSIGSTNLAFTDFLSIVNRNGEPNVNIGGSTQKLERFFGRVDFDYNKWLSIGGTISRDRDSRLVPKTINFTNKEISATYYGGSAALLLHNLIPGIGDGHKLNFAKIRGAISKTGTVGQLQPYDNESRYGAATFFPFGSTQGYVRSTQLIDANFKPEFVNTKEVGLELGFLKNRVSFEATYYNQNNTNQILGINLSSTTGYNSFLKNAGAFTNNGLELDLKLTPLVTIKDVSIGIKVNYTYQTSKVTQIVPGLDEIGVGSNNYVIVGKSAYVFKLVDYMRDPATGKVIVDKGTGMPSINTNLTTFGKTTPDNIFGGSLNVDWKNISFTAVVDYRTGNQVLNDDLGGFLDDNGISARSAENGRRAFVFPNSVYLEGGKYVDNANVYTRDYGRLFYNEDINNNVQTNYLADGSFFKLREVSMTYTMPQSLFASSKAIKGVSFGVTGRNLLTWRPKSNQWSDPEFSTGTGNAQGSASAANLPPTRIFGANVKITF